MDSSGDLAQALRPVVAELERLIKLEWYRLGGEASERQSSDVRRVARLYGTQLDRAYIRSWSGQLGIHDLVERLFRESDADQE